MKNASLSINPCYAAVNGVESLPMVRLMGVRVHAVTMQQVIDVILKCLQCGRGGMVITPNLDILRRAVHDEKFRALMAQADLVVADGMPLVWASRLQRTPLPERVAGSTLIKPLAGRAAAEGRRVFFLGGEPGAAAGAAEVLQMAYRNLHVAGCICPPFGFEHDETYMKYLRRSLRHAAPDIIFVALGSPKQERLIAELRDELPCAWWLGVGISFSFLSGSVRRAPGWMQRIGLEWLHRLAQEPARLGRRYLVDGIPFALRLLVHSAAHSHLGILKHRST
jgi:N-acetylglucosaminyldiphosphoundecaprenol N-acetyl-beta-D-mannosaminyltransferase